jgi:hypothetical protein
MTARLFPGFTFRSILLGLAIVSIPVASAPAQMMVGQAPTERQVVMFGVLATPGSTEMDPKITPAVAAQLRKTLPNHGFKLIQVKSQRVMTGQSLALNLGDGFVSSAQLMSALDPNGKVQMRFELTYEGTSQFQTVVVTPADQFNFFDKMLPNNNRLLIGVGAR